MGVGAKPVRSHQPCHVFLQAVEDLQQQRAALQAQINRLQETLSQVRPGTDLYAQLACGCGPDALSQVEREKRREVAQAAAEAAQAVAEVVAEERSLYRKWLANASQTAAALEARLPQLRAAEQVGYRLGMLCSLHPLQSPDEWPLPEL